MLIDSELIKEMLRNSIRTAQQEAAEATKPDIKQRRYHASAVYESVLIGIEELERQATHE